MSNDGEDFVLTPENLAELWLLATKEEIGITFQVEEKHAAWLKQKLYAVRKELGIADEIILHLNNDNHTFMMYRRSEKDALP